MGVPLSPYYSRIKGSVIKKRASLTPYYTRVRNAAEKGEAPPDLGQVSEMIRSALTKEYGIYPPNLSTTISPDGSITITGVNNDTGLNIQITLKNLAGNLVMPPPGGTVPGVVPQGAPPGPEGPVGPGV